MIIEFAGLPGIGKSTSHAKLLEELHASGRVTATPKEIEVDYLKKRYYPSYTREAWYEGAVRCLYYLGANLELSIKELLHRRVTSLLPSRARASAYWLVKDKRLAMHFLNSMADSDQTIFYLDEGLLQHSAALLTWGGLKWLPFVSELASSRIASQLTVLFIDGDCNTAYERFCKREYPSTWPAGLDANEIQETIRDFKTQLEMVLKIWSKAGATVKQIKTDDLLAIADVIA